MQEAPELNISQIRRIYMVGICGAGMTALAQVLQGWGKTVSGSDGVDRFPTDDVLERLQIPVHHGFSVENIPAAVDVVVVSSAYGKDHPEVTALRERGIPILEYAHALGVFFRHKRLIAVSGTHGKTTTTAMIGTMLQEAGMDPTVVCGAQVLAWGSNALVGQSEWVVLEADEYQNKFQWYHPEILVITSIDWDHPDYFTDAQSYREVFRRFAERVPATGSIVSYTDDVDVWEVVQGLSANVVSYGRRHHRTHHIIEESQQKGTQRFWIQAETRLGPFALALSGAHNVSNAAAALSVALEIGVPIEAIRKGLQRFQGTERRMQVVGTMPNGSTIIDDYAHHPAEVAATLSGLRARYGKKPIHVAFQAHTYTRTEALLEEFSHCFGDADSVIITDIFESAREKGAIHEVTPESFVQSIATFHQNVRYVAWKDLEAAIRSEARPEDVWVMMGAGDGWKLARQLVRPEGATMLEPRQEDRFLKPRNSHASAEAPARSAPASTILSRSGLAQTSQLSKIDPPIVAHNAVQDPDLFGQLTALVGGDKKRVEENAPLAKYTTFRIGGPARWLVKVRSADELVAVAQLAHEKEIPLSVFSGGANILFGDAAWPGIVIKCEDRTFDIDRDTMTVTAGSGVPLIYFAQQTAQAGLSGAEFCAAIPGAVGGAVRGNAGAFGGEMKDIVKSVEIWDGQERRTLTNAECGFAYRTSAIKKHNQDISWSVIPALSGNLETTKALWLVLQATFRLKPGDAAASQEKIKELLKKKSSSQSLEDPSAGCMFKNIAITPEFWNDPAHARWQETVPREFIDCGSIPSAWLIDRAELKGRQIGGAQVSLKHGNFIVNTGQATAADVLMLVSIIKQKIRTMFGVQLEEEIELVGL